MLTPLLWRGWDDYDPFVVLEGRGHCKVKGISGDTEVEAVRESLSPDKIVAG